LNSFSSRLIKNGGDREVGDERVAETWVGMRLKREEREIYLPLACPVELLRTI
jgi:hypothetical protein